MKKTLLIATIVFIGIMSAVGIFYSQQSSSAIHPSTEAPKATTENPFVNSEHAFRQITRHGDEDSIAKLNTSLSAMAQQMADYKHDGFSVDKLESMFATYRDDSLYTVKRFSPYLDQLLQYDQFETSYEPSFMKSLDQIGFYELKSAYSDLNTLRQTYLKEPTEESKAAYIAQANKIKTIVNDLYLDSLIEKPLLDFLTNHERYFQTVASAYSDAGYERIGRIKQTSYAIGTELQLLPSK